jgi:hypothetical protein
VNALDREVLELLHERPDLLAVADAVAATQERRRRPRAALAPAVAVAAAVVLFLVAPWQNHGPNIFDRALAAVGTGPVIHAVVAFSGPNDVVVNLATGEERQRAHRNEFWYDAERGELRSRTSTDGGAPTDFATRDQLFANLTPAQGGFAIDYRDSLKRGDARVVGDAEVDGRRAKRIEFGPNRGGGVQQVTVDAETFVPLTMQTTYPGGFHTPVTHVLSIESLPYDASDFKPHNSIPRPVSGHIGATSDVSLAGAAQALGGSLLVLDRASDSVKLSQPNVELTNGDKLTGVLVQLTYGDVEVWLATDRGGAFFANLDQPQPEGSMVLWAQRTHGWRGEFRKDGFAVGVSAPTKSQVLAAARDLTPQG